MLTDQAHSTKRSRVLAAGEAVFPIASAQAYIWIVPHERPRWLDLLFGTVLTVILVAIVLRRGLLSWRTFGLAWGADHRRSALPLALFTAGAIAVLLVWGWQAGRLRNEADLYRALVAYPVWGLVQQGLMFGIVYPRMRLAVGVRAAPYLTALLFAAAHLPNPLLMAGGALMVLVYGFVWERNPSLPLVALSHGVIGAVCDKALHVSLRVGAHYFNP